MDTRRGPASAAAAAVAVWQCDNATRTSAASCACVRVGREAGWGKGKAREGKGLLPAARRELFVSSPFVLISRPPAPVQLPCPGRAHPRLRRCGGLHEALDLAHNLRMR